MAWFDDSSTQRRVSQLPIWILPLFLISLLAQISWHAYRTQPTVEIQPLLLPPSDSLLQVLSFAEPVAFSKLLMLWLQSHDRQAGVSLPFRQMDYVVLGHWLDAILSLDPDSDYPLVAAVSVYAEVADKAKKRQMLDLVQRHFLQAPNRRWPWMAHAVFIARHQLDDAQLALRYAALLADNTRPDQVPSWARQMHLLLLADLGELESAQILLAALIESGELTDAKEQAFLSQRILDAEKNHH